VARSPNAGLPQEQKQFTRAIQLCDGFIFSSAGAPTSIADLKAAVAQALTQPVSTMLLGSLHVPSLQPACADPAINQQHASLCL
jgi:hypothetical protein